MATAATTNHPATAVAIIVSIMSRTGWLHLLLALSAVVLPAQTPGTRTIQANGTATQTANPDQAQLEVGVVTNGATAQESAQLNATQTTAVLNAVKAVLGANGTVQTVSYSLYPRYSNDQRQPSVIIGYTTNNENRGPIQLFPFVDILKDGQTYTSFGPDPFTNHNELQYHTFQAQDAFTKDSFVAAIRERVEAAK